MTSAFVARPRGAGGDAPRAPVAAARVLPDHAALDPLRAILSDPAVTDVFINGVDGLFVDRGAGIVRVPGWSSDEQSLRTLAVTLVGIGGRHLDDASPLVDVRWEGGARVHAVLPPISCGGVAVSIRLPSVAMPDLDALGRTGMFDGATGSRLEGLVDTRANILVTGATGAGKTTLLAALLSRVRHDERIVTVEDVAELRLAHPHHVRLEARQPNLEGAGGVDLARLVREALRMRPDRLVVGECRGSEVRELLTALNTGHDGGAGTVHVGGIRDLPSRLEALGALAGMGETTLARHVVSAIDAVVHLERGADGIRRVAAMARPVLRADRLDVEELS